MSQGGAGIDHTIPVVNKFIDDSRYKHETIFVTKGLTASDVNFESAFRVFNIQGTLNKDNRTIKDGILYLDVPIWGLFPISNDVHGPLTGNGIERQVNIPKIATGKFKLSLDSKNQDVMFSYSLKTEFAGQHEEAGFSILSLTDERVKNAVPDEVAAKAVQPPKLSAQEQENHTELLRKFLSDHIVDENHFVVESYTPGTPPGSGSPKATSGSYTYKAVILTVFQFDGAISPGAYAASGALYIRVPVWGRVRLTNIVGNLKDGLTLNINLLVATGVVKLFLQRNAGKEELHAKINLTAKFLGKFDDTVKVLTIPF